MSDTQATFLATLVDEWARAGVTDAVVCPGNRSTLLTAILDADERVRVHVVVDERSASFFALGLAKATGRPAVFWCTSGTATAQAHSAVIEAHYARVPLLVCTANRPPELQHVRDWQSIDQTQLYVGMTRWTFAPGVADDAMASSWRSLASRSVFETVLNPAGPGPVHLDLAIREPWVLDVGELPDGQPDGRSWYLTAASAKTSANGIPLDTKRNGVFVVGECDIDSDALYAAAERLEWPVFAEARSGVRRSHPNCITAYDSILRNEIAAPDVVVHLGTPSISKQIASWSAEAEHWFVESFARWDGMKQARGVMWTGHASEFCGGLDGPGASGDWLEGWQQAESKAQVIYDKQLQVLNEPAVARTLATQFEGNLFAATSMPVRDIESFSGSNLNADVYANRGASGMEGMTSTAAGIAVATQKPTALLTGDLSFLYDLNALWSLPDLDLVVVVVDNNGGGIFSTLPQLSELTPEKFERVVATPHNVDIPAVVSALGARCAAVAELNELMPAVEAAIVNGGVQVVYAKTDRAANAQLHKDLHAAVASALQ